MKAQFIKKINTIARGYKASYEPVRRTLQQWAQRR